MFNFFHTPGQLHLVPPSQSKYVNKKSHLIFEYFGIPKLVIEKYKCYNWCKWVLFRNIIFSITYMCQLINMRNNITTDIICDQTWREFWFYLFFQSSIRCNFIFWPSSSGSTQCQWGFLRLMSRPKNVTNTERGNVILIQPIKPGFWTSLKGPPTPW